MLNYNYIFCIRLSSYVSTHKMLTRMRLLLTIEICRDERKLGLFAINTTSYQTDFFVPSVFHNWLTGPHSFTATFNTKCISILSSFHFLNL